MAYFFNTVAFVRHGQTLWNLEKRTQGHLDSPLTDLGISQAKTSAQKLNNFISNTIISSPLGRAYETARIIATEKGISEILIFDFFAERHLGVLQGLQKSESMQKYPQLWSTEGKFMQDAVVPEGETIDSFLERVKKGVEEIKKMSQEKPIIVVTHDGVLHAVLSLVQKIPFSQVHQHYTFVHGEPIFLE